MQSPTIRDWQAAKDVLRYLAGNDLSLRYSTITDTGPTLIGYSDSNYGGDLLTRRSVGAYVFSITAAVSWRSKLQPTVALSSTEAEYMALCAAGQEAVALRKLKAHSVDWHTSTAAHCHL